MTLVAAAVASLSPAAGAQPVPVPISAETFTLTILHNNDGESKLLPDPEAGFPGVARFVTLMKAIQAMRAVRGGVVTLSAGDNFLASQELGVSLARGGPLYDSIALSGLYDAMVLGNHDFDLGGPCPATRWWWPPSTSWPTAATATRWPASSSCRWA